MVDLNCKMFADDTTLYESDSNTNTLISKFKNKLELLTGASIKNWILTGLNILNRLFKFKPVTKNLDLNDFLHHVNDEEKIMLLVN